MLVQWRFSLTSFKLRTLNFVDGIQHLLPLGCRIVRCDRYRWSMDRSQLGAAQRSVTRVRAEPSGGIGPWVSGPSTPRRSDTSGLWLVVAVVAALVVVLGILVVPMGPPSGAPCDGRTSRCRAERTFEPAVPCFAWSADDWERQGDPSRLRHLERTVAPNLSESQRHCSRAIWTADATDWPSSRWASGLWSFATAGQCVGQGPVVSIATSLGSRGRSWNPPQPPPGAASRTPFRCERQAGNRCPLKSSRSWWAMPSTRSRRSSSRP